MKAHIRHCERSAAIQLCRVLEEKWIAAKLRFSQ
jgi:hypothetical protein